MVFENKQNRLKNLKVKQKVYIKVNKINKVIDSNSILLNPGLINSYIHRLGGEDIDNFFTLYCMELTHILHIMI